MAKATVQAVLGAQTVAHLPADATAAEKTYANIILTVCVLSIVITAPTGAILITLTGNKLLSKTKQPPNLEGKVFHSTPIDLRFNLLLPPLLYRLAQESPAVVARHQHHRRGGGARGSLRSGHPAKYDIESAH